jgi:hypothetical protein
MDKAQLEKRKAARAAAAPERAVKARDFTFTAMQIVFYPVPVSSLSPGAEDAEFIDFMVVLGISSWQGAQGSCF